MIEDRVGELRLKLRTDAAEPETLRAAAEQFVRATLERCAGLLEARRPGRVVLLRRLPLHWRLDEAMLDDDAEIDALARTAADAIERGAAPPRIDPPPDSEGPLLFDDEAQWRASHLLARVRGETAWFHAALDDDAAGEPLAALAAPERRDLAAATLLHLARAGALAEVLAAQPPLAVAVLAAAWRCDVSMPVATASIVDPRVEALATMARAWPMLPTAARMLALHVHAAVLLDEDLQGDAARALASAASLHRSVAALEPLALPKTSELATETAAEDQPPEDARAELHTHAAGLFYLLARVQELDLAETLWQACLPEGMVLACAARALLGPDFAGDPAPSLFGGVSGVADDLAVNVEQQAEVTIAACSALAAALPRRGLAELPPVVVSLAEHTSGRLLVAAAEGAPFAFFAWPAATPEAMVTGLRALLAAWPHNAVMSAPPALARLDGSGRLLPRRDPARADLWLPQASSAAAAALLAVVAGAPCTLFAARLQAWPLDDMASLVRRWLARDARLRLGHERLDIVLTAERHDLDLRRAGLDQDPGWMPWLGRHLRFVFEERGASAAFD